MSYTVGYVHDLREQISTNTLLDPILDWGQSPESAKESKEKDKEIGRLKSNKVAAT
jgi:hypothetical protein